MKMAEATCKSLISDVLESNKAKIKAVSHEIWSHPETSWKEKHACEILTQYLLKEGFEVEKHFTSETGFRAVFESPVNKSKEGAGDSDQSSIKVCYLCQYDALPEVGHAAGHNLVTAASLAAAVVIKRLLEEKEMIGKVNIVVMINYPSPIIIDLQTA